MSLTRRAAIATVAAAGLAPRARAQTHARAQGKPIRIGLVCDLNAVYADVGGLGNKYAAQLAAEEVGNSVLGRPIEILQADCANKPDLAANITREWIDTQGVDVIVDGASSGAGLAMQQVTREKDRIYIIIGPATSDLTGKACSPLSFHWPYDTYALAKVTGEAITKGGGKSWFFLTVDYAFGEALQRDTTRFIEAAGGKVTGATKFALGTTDFSSYLLQAQASGADIIGMAAAGADVQNILKQASEFGLMQAGKQRLAALLMFITDVFSVGLPVAGGLELSTSFYWDRTDQTRAFTKRFMAFKPKPPSMLQAGTYSGVRHWLAAVQKAGTTDSKAVAAAMKAMPVNDMNNENVQIRADGRVLGTMYLVRVKTPAESRGPFDVYSVVAAVPGGEAYRPASDHACPLVT